MNRTAVSIALILLVASILATAQEQKLVIVQEPVKVQVSKPVAIRLDQPLAVQLDSGTAKTPLVIAGTIHEEKTPDEQKAERAKAAEDHVLSNATVLLVWLTGGLGAAALASAVAAFWTGRLTLRSIRVAEMATAQLSDLERAYVFVTVERVGFTPDTVGHRFNIKIRFRNHGKTPAIIQSLRYDGLHAETPPEKLIEHKNANRELPPGLVIGIGKVYEETLHLRTSGEQLTQLSDLVHHAYVFGLMKYKDVMQVEHEVGFCWMSQPQAHNGGIQFIICPSKLNRFT